MAENLLRPHGHFVTLTYRPELQPVGLVAEDLTKFLKRLRHHQGKFRYYAVGEYGDKSGHSHFHMCYWPDNALTFDRQIRQDGIHRHPSLTNEALQNRFSGKGGLPKSLYTSVEIGKAWELGYHSVSPLLETGSIRYVIGYVQKKMRKTEYVTDDGEILPRPYAVMSKNLGNEYILKHQDAIAINGYVIIGGRKYPIGKDTLKLFSVENKLIVESDRASKKRLTSFRNLDALEENLLSQKRSAML